MKRRPRLLNAIALLLIGTGCSSGRGAPPGSPGTATDQTLTELFSLSTVFQRYIWSYCTTTYSALRAVVFEFAETRGGQHVRQFLGLPGEQGWRGKLVCDDFSAYKACFELGVTEAGCLAHYLERRFIWLM